MTDYAGKRQMRIKRSIAGLVFLITLLGTFAADLEAVGAASLGSTDLKSITWKVESETDIGGLSYHIRKIVAVNGVDVDSSEDMKSSYAFCVEPKQKAPDKGTSIGSTYTAGKTSEGGNGEKIYTFNGDEAAEDGFKMMRKFCYYLPSGYGWKKTTKKWYEDYKESLGNSTSESDVRTSYTLGATVLAKRWAKDADDPEGNANYAYNRLNAKGRALVDKFMTGIPDLPNPPKDYIAFYIQKDGAQDIWGSLYAEEYGKLQVKKSTARSSITDSNNCYSLAGAEFTVYTDSKCTEKAKLKDGSNAVLKTKADGSSDAVEMATGDYYIKETKAPEGYALDDKVYEITVSEEATHTYSCKDEPITDLVNLLLTKDPKGYPHDHGEGDATLKGAVYKFSYYDGQYSTAAKAEDSGKSTRTWYFVTDESGKIDGQSPKKSSKHNSGDLYKDKDGKTAYPLGTYVIQEVDAPEGYLVNDEKLVVHIIEDGTDDLHVKTYNEKIKGEDTVIRGGVKLAKIDNDLDEAYAQGDATLKDAEFTVFNKSKESVMVGGKEYTVDEACLAIKTDENGIAASSDHALPYGSYLIKETKPSEGYLLNEKWSRSFEIREDGVVIDLTGDKVREAVERGGVQIIKRDKELKKSEALGGAKLDGIVMTIKNTSGRDVIVRKDLDNKTDTVDWKTLKSKKELLDAGTIVRVPTGQDVGRITVHWNEEKKSYTAETLADDLPYGTYTIRESKTNNTYQRTDKSEHQFKVREDGTIYSYDDGENEAVLTFDDYVYRSDLQGTKIGDGSSERLSYVPFKITSVTNDETHVLVTDKNGYFSTKDKRTQDQQEEDEDADTNRKQNPFDDLLTAESVKTEDIEKRKEDIKCGVWFGTGEFGSTAAMNSNFGALPYDSYVIEELPCEKNDGYTLQKFFFTVDEKSQNGSVDLETITDDIPEIGTEASVDGNNVDVTPKKEITLIDVIEYSGLKKGGTYTAKGRLIDKATGEAVKDAAGKEITSEQEFTARNTQGKVKVKFTFDGSNMYGKETVVYEAVYAADGHIAAKHEDLEDENQTVTWEKPDPKYEMYKIRTTKAPSKGDKFGFFAQDEVEYEVHVKNTGNIVLTMDVSDKFTQEPGYFTEPQLKDVKFSGEGTWNNKEAAVNKVIETSDKNTETKVAEDESTTSENNEAESPADQKEEPAADSSDSAAESDGSSSDNDADPTDAADHSGDSAAGGLDDDSTGSTADVTEEGVDDQETAEAETTEDQKDDSTAEQEESKPAKSKQTANITIYPGETAVITFTAVIKDEAKEYLAAAAKDSDSLDEKGNDTNKEYQKNKPDEKDGYRNTAYCENVTYPDPEHPEEPGELDPKEDDAQTPVQKPEIGTTLADDKGNKSIVASEKTVLIDTISYKGLDTSKWYAFTGELIVKDTKDPLVENGKPVKVTGAPFKPEKADGLARVTFVINTSNLAGKEIVAFENAYRLEGYKKGAKMSEVDKVLVASHRDLNDKSQTVKVTEEPKETSKDKPKKEAPKKSTQASSVSNGDTPKTGDERNPWLWIGVILAGLVFLGAGACVFGKGRI